MKVIILCGGLGTRLREETEFRPKPMVDIGGRPILWHIMKIYAHHGFNDFVLCLGYRGNMIKEYFLNYEAMNNDFTICLGQQRRDPRITSMHDEQDFRVTLADTGADTMTGGRVKRVQKYVDGDTFMVTYGDGVADVDVARTARLPPRHGKLATVTAVRPLSRFGVLDVDDDGPVQSFVEKPQIRRLGQRRLLCLRARSLRLHRRRRVQSWSASRSNASPARASSWPTGTRLLLRHGYLPRVQGPQRHLGERQGSLESVGAVNVLLRIRLWPSVLTPR